MPDDLGSPAAFSAADLIPAHPAAELFPMMSEAALTELAEDIRENGLINRIVLDPEGRSVVDGRNRQVACRLAGVEPEFERLDEGVDPLSFVVSLNVKRRSLTKPQLAIAAARAWAQAESRGEVQTHGGDRTSAQNGHLIGSPRDHFGRLFGVSKNYVDMARLVVAYSADLAEQVSVGSARLEDAHQEATAADRRRDQERDAMVRLRSLAPDLADRIEREEITISEAEAIFRDRDAAFREQRRTLFHVLYDTVRNLNTIANAPGIRDLPTIIAVEDFETEFREFFKGGSSELIQGLRQLPDAKTVLEALLRDLERTRK